MSVIQIDRLKSLLEVNEVCRAETVETGLKLFHGWWEGCVSVVSSLIVIDQEIVAISNDWSECDVVEAIRIKSRLVISDKLKQIESYL